MIPYSDRSIFLFKRLLLALLVLGLLSVGASSSAGAQGHLDEVVRLVERHFYAPKSLDDRWRQKVQEARRCASEAQNPERVHAIIKDLLATLHTSHTGLYLPSEPFYYFLASTFGPRMEGFQEVFPAKKVLMPDSGMLAASSPEGVFVQSVLEGGPAERSGIRVGDRILAVNGRHWNDLESFRQRKGRKVAVTIQRLFEGPAQVVEIVPRLVNPQDAFLEASRNSARVLERGGCRIAYYHIWAFTDDRIYEQFADFSREHLAGCQGLILDLRDGIGGGDSERQWLMVTRTPRVDFFDRKGRKSGTSGGGWGGPLVVLINERTRSGKELFAAALKKAGRAVLVGTRTAGAGTGGQAFFLSDGSILYLAVAGVRVEGENLEGRGVEPDVLVDRPIPYSQGRDPQYERAIDVMVEKLERCQGKVPER